MKKGFTLIELLATIVLLGVIAFITYPAINNIIKNSKDQALEDTVSNLENMAHLYSTKNSLGYDVTEKSISLTTLLSAGYINEVPTDPATGEELTGCVMYSWKYDQYVFRYDDDCQVKS